VRQPSSMLRGPAGPATAASPRRLRPHPLSLTSRAQRSSPTSRRPRPGLRRRRRVRPVHDPSCVVRTPRILPGLFKPPPPLEFPHPSRPRLPVCRPQTLAAAAESSSSPSFRRREVTRELRLEVSNAPVPLVEELVHHGALSDLAELRLLD
jgi:hypothetical protein